MLRRALTVAIAGFIFALPIPPVSASSLTEDEVAAKERVLIVRPNDTLGELLAGAGIDPSQVHAAISALTPIFPAKALRPGHEVAIQTDPTRDNALVEVEIEPAPGRTIRARLRDGRWQAEELIAPQQRLLTMATGSIEGGIFPAMTEAGLPPGLALSLVRVLGHQIDFQRDLRPGDQFSVLFERFRGDDGDLFGHGRVLQVELTLSGKRLAFWRHETAAGVVDWFDASGKSLRRSFLRTPLDGARVSSGFGVRTHPVLGFNRMHRGMDFAAPTGTPVYAAADGKIASARAEGGYGRMVRLRHNGGVETRYAHLSRFARGMLPGRKVKQGDVIGAVGSTGLSTGPHLHYEVMLSGRTVNPATHISQAIRLAGRDLTAFHAARQTLAKYAATVRPNVEVAMAD